jgi:hypothetical protein
MFLSGVGAASEDSRDPRKHAHWRVLTLKLARLQNQTCRVVKKCTLRGKRSLQAMVSHPSDTKEYFVHNALDGIQRPNGIPQSDTALA